MSWTPICPTAPSTGPCSTCCPRGRCWTRSSRLMIAGGVLIIYVATVTQLSRAVEALRAAAVLDRTAGMGDAAAGLARRRPGRPAAAFDARAHRVLGRHATACARRDRPGRRWAASARAGTASRRCERDDRRTDSSSNSGCAATRRSAASRTSTAWPRSPDTTPTPMPARRYRSCEPVSAADTLNLRRSSATTGRITDRFCLSDRTSPSNTSNSSQPIHISGAAVRPGAGAGGGAGAGPGAGAGAGPGGGGAGWSRRAGELPRASSISAVCRDNCQPPWKGVNSIGKVNVALFAWAVLTRDSGHHVGRILVRPRDVVRHKGHRQVAVVAKRVGELVQGVRALRRCAFDEAHLVDAGKVRVDEPVQHVDQSLGRRAGELSGEPR